MILPALLCPQYSAEFISLLIQAARSQKTSSA
jgi:hypothetical protein